MPSGSMNAASWASDVPADGHATVRHFSTRGVPQPWAIDAWNDAFAQFAPVTFQAARPDEFHGELHTGSLGDLSFAYVRIAPCVVERSCTVVWDETSPYVALMFMQRGGAELKHCGRTSVLCAGDIVLCDTSQPVSCRFADGAAIIVVRAPAMRLSARLPNRQRLSGRPLRRGHGLTDTLFAMAQSLNTLLDEEPPAFIGRSVSSHFLDFLATTYALAYGHELADTDAAEPRRQKVLNYIESKLHDPELSPQTVAAATRISIRQLYSIMSESGESTSAYIMRRRLEECAKLLANPEQSSRRAIFDIALSLGFKSDAHFSRSFKHKFGMTARDYRRLHRPVAGSG